MRRGLLRVIAVLVSGAFLVGGLTGPGAAADPVTDRKKELDRQIAQLRDELEGTSKQFADAAVALRQAQAELVVVQAELVAADAALAKAEARDAAVASQLAFAQAEEAKAARDLAGQQDAERQTRAELGRIARDAYVNSGNTGLAGLSVALQAETPDQFTDRLALASTALQSQKSTINRLSAQQADLRARTARLGAVRLEVADLKTQSAAAVRDRQVAQDAAQAARDRQAQLVSTQQAALAVIRARAAAEQASLNQMTAEQNKLQAVLAARARTEAAKHGKSIGAAPPPATPGVLGYPASGPITSGFGQRYHPILHIWRMHTGIDFGIGCGTPVYAAAGGTVVSGGWAGGYGNRIVIDHGWVSGADLATSYNHLSRIVVGSGSVSRGQLIAYSGTTGLSTGCHLHFETLANGSYVNPMRYL